MGASSSLITVKTDNNAKRKDKLGVNSSTNAFKRGMNVKRQDKTGGNSSLSAVKRDNKVKQKNIVGAGSSSTTIKRDKNQTQGNCDGKKQNKETKATYQNTMVLQGKQLLNGSSDKAVVKPKKHISVKGAKLGKYTDIYLDPCEIGNLELKEYPPVKVTGIVALSEERFVVIDELKKIVTYTADASGQYGKFGSWIKFKAMPKGVCRIENDLYIAFSDRTVKQIAMLENLVEEHSFVMEYKCSGIMEYKGNLAVGLENGKIILVDTKGKCLKTIVLPKPNNGTYIPRSLTETPDGNIMFCEPQSRTVICVKENGSIVFTYRGMEHPYCAVFDKNHNIIVVGEGVKTGETIQLLTDKGNKVKVLKYRKELGMQPYYITNVKDTLKLAICGDSNKIQFYKIDKCRARTRRELQEQLKSNMS